MKQFNWLFLVLTSFFIAGITPLLFWPEYKWSDWIVLACTAFIGGIFPFAWGMDCANWAEKHSVSFLDACWRAVSAATALPLMAYTQHTSRANRFLDLYLFEVCAIAAIAGVWNGIAEAKDAWRTRLPPWPGTPTAEAASQPEANLHRQTGPLFAWPKKPDAPVFPDIKPGAIFETSCGPHEVVEVVEVSGNEITFKDSTGNVKTMSTARFQRMRDHARWPQDEQP